MKNRTELPWRKTNKAASGIAEGSTSKSSEASPKWWLHGRKMEKRSGHHGIPQMGTIWVQYGDNMGTICMVTIWWQCGDTDTYDLGDDHLFSRKIHQDDWPWHWFPNHQPADLSPLYHHLPHRTPIKGGHMEVSWNRATPSNIIQSSILRIRVFMDCPLFLPFRSSSDKGVPPGRHGNVPIFSTCSCSVSTERRSKGKTQLRNSREIQEPCAPSTALRDAFGKTMEDLQKT